MTGATGPDGVNARDLILAAIHAVPHRGADGRPLTTREWHRTAADTAVSALAVAGLLAPGADAAPSGWPDAAAEACGLIIAAVAGAFGVSADAIVLSRANTRDSTVPRQVAMVLCRELLGLSTVVVGRVFGRHHTTVMHAEKAVAGYRTRCDHVRVFVDLAGIRAHAVLDRALPTPARRIA